MHLSARTIQVLSCFSVITKTLTPNWAELSPLFWLGIFSDTLQNGGCAPQNVNQRATCSNELPGFISFSTLPLTKKGKNIDSNHIYQKLKKLSEGSPPVYPFPCFFIHLLYLFSDSNINKPFKAPQTAKSANVTECPARKATGARLLFKRWRASLILPAFSKEFTLNSSQWST